MAATAPSVVVTGLGTVTPLGGDVASTWQAILDNRSGVRALTERWAEDLPIRIAAPAAIDPAAHLALPHAQARRLDRAAQLAHTAADEAWADAGLAGDADGLDRERLSVSVSSIIGLQTLLAAHTALNTKGWRHIPPHTIPTMLSSSAAAHLAIHYGADGSAHAPASACASGAEAIAHACRLIRAGEADLVIAGGTEAPIHPFTLASFATMRALSPRNDDPQGASRPFARDRDGFVLGEGAAILICENEAHARARGARPYGRILAGGASIDAHHIAQPQPSGHAAAKALTRALTQAGLAPGDVHHINAHATSTPMGDLAEHRALTRVFGAHLGHIPVTAPKSHLGHTQGAAGAIETLTALLSLHHRTVPPTRNHHPETQDPDTPLLLTAAPAPLPAGRPLAAVTNSFGFGGHNHTLALATA